jgi:hypothetical protein
VPRYECHHLCSGQRTGGKSTSDRLTAATQTGLRTDSLVGSFFHSDAEHSWQGCVVAEVAPTVYLVELMSWIDGSGTSQKRVRLEDMKGWVYYDDAEWMRNAYEAEVKDRWEVAREQR